MRIDPGHNHPDHPPAAQIFIAARCTHCQATLDALVRLVKAGTIARLEVVNLDAGPGALETARAPGVRSVPVTRIGAFELFGALSHAELSHWVDLAASGEGEAAYLAHQIESGRLAAVITRARGEPGVLDALIALFAAEDTPMAVRIGISAVMEALAGEPGLRQAADQFAALTLSGSPQVRADACWFLGLAGDATLLPAVRRLLDDADPGVREVAEEVVEVLGGGNPTAAPGA
jgi:hypothetical protein